MSLWKEFPAVLIPFCSRITRTRKSSAKRLRLIWMLEKFRGLRPPLFLRTERRFLRGLKMKPSTRLRWMPFWKPPRKRRFQSSRCKHLKNSLSRKRGANSHLDLKNLSAQFMPMRSRRALLKKSSLCSRRFFPVIFLTACRKSILILRCFFPRWRRPLVKLQSSVKTLLAWSRSFPGIRIFLRLMF